MSTPSLPSEKRCSKCGATKPVTEFYQKCKTSPVRQSICKQCSSQYYKTCSARKCQEKMPPLPICDGVEIRHCPGWEGYAVGDNGLVWSCRTPFRRWSRMVYRKDWRQMVLVEGGRSGHLRVQVRRPDGTCKGEFVHRLVLEAFVGPCPEGMEARHFPDRNPANNSIHNLAWGTPAENTADSIVHGTHYYFGSGEDNPNTKRTDEMVRAIYTAAQSHSYNEVAAMFGVQKCYVAAIATKRIRKTALI